MSPPRRSFRLVRCDGAMVCLGWHPGADDEPAPDATWRFDGAVLALCDDHAERWLGVVPPKRSRAKDGA